MTRRTVFALAVVLALGSCRSVTAPSPPGQRARAPSPAPTRDDAARGSLHGRDPASGEERAQVPVITAIESVYDASGVHFRMHLAPDELGDNPFYAPRTPGGWQFQLFINVDQQPTGYLAGYEFLTRDSEPELEPGTVLLRRTEGGGGPGGWGDGVAFFPIEVAPRILSFTLPLEAIQDDGALDFGIDLYATVLGGPDGATPVAGFVRGYYGSSAPIPGADLQPITAVSAATPSEAPGAGSGSNTLMERLTSRR